MNISVLGVSNAVFLEQHHEVTADEALIYRDAAVVIVASRFTDGTDTTFSRERPLRRGFIF